MKIRLSALATLHGSQYETLSSYQMAHIYILQELDQGGL